MPERSPVPTVVTVHDLSFFEAPSGTSGPRSCCSGGPSGWRPAGGGGGLPEPGDRRGAGPVVPGGGRGGGGPPRGRHRPVPARRAGGRRRRRRAGRGSTPGCRRGVRSWCSWGPSSPGRTCPTLVRAFAPVADRHPDALLVLAGGAGWGVADVERPSPVSGVGDRIVRTGYVPDEAVPALLRSAAAAVYPALYEGFGLPALEALACGAPLVTTRGRPWRRWPATPPCWSPPGDVGALAEALDAVLAGPPRAVTGRRRAPATGPRASSPATPGRPAPTQHMEAYRPRRRDAADRPGRIPVRRRPRQ